MNRFVYHLPSSDIHTIVINPWLSNIIYTNHYWKLGRRRVPHTLPSAVYRGTRQKLCLPSAALGKEYFAKRQALSKLQHSVSSLCRVQ